jgi:hypothetical protein
MQNTVIAVYIICFKINPQVVELTKIVIVLVISGVDEEACVTAVFVSISSARM